METFGNITLHHGDCMDVLRSLPDNAFDLGVVDCPYGDAQQSDNQTVTEGGGGYYNRFGSPNSRFERYKRQVEVEPIQRRQQHQPICPTYGTSEADSADTITPPHQNTLTDSELLERAGHGPRNTPKKS